MYSDDANNLKASSRQPYEITTSSTLLPFIQLHHFKIGVLSYCTYPACSAESKSEASGPVEEVDSSEHQTPESQSEEEKHRDPEPQTALVDLSDKSFNEQDVSAMEVE